VLPTIGENTRAFINANSSGRSCKRSHFPVSATLVYVVGFVAAVTIGSIAWYNSKRPPVGKAKSVLILYLKFKKKKLQVWVNPSHKWSVVNGQ
jgi:hypothetical protein